MPSLTCMSFTNSLHLHLVLRSHILIHILFHQFSITTSSSLNHPQVFKNNKNLQHKKNQTTRTTCIVETHSPPIIASIETIENPKPKYVHIFWLQSMSSFWNLAFTPPTFCLPCSFWSHMNFLGWKKYFNTFYAI